MNLTKYKIKLINDNPTRGNLEDNIIYVVGNKDYIKWAYVKCPCGCNEQIMLSLNKKSFPSWKVWFDRLGRASITPSIYRTEGCKSHFWIIKGNVEWSNQLNSSAQ